MFYYMSYVIFFFKQKTAYEMRISDWSSDVCSSDLDLLKLAGVQETDLYRAVLDTVKSRSAWLLVNLAAAVAGANVIALFEGTIERIVALAILMPIVASMGGNTGTQTLTVAVRALATRDLNRSNALRFIGKELLVGLAHGSMFALLAGTTAWFWLGAPMIGGILRVEMVIHQQVSEVVGALLPLGPSGRAWGRG